MVAKKILKFYGWVLNRYCKSTVDLQQQRVKSVKRCTTITELVVIWGVCSVCTGVTKSKAVIFVNNTSHLNFAMTIARSWKNFQYICSDFV